MTIAICFAAIVTLAFFFSTQFNKYKAEDAAAMRRVFSERMKTIYTCTTPEQFEVLKKHINDDADKFRLKVHPDVVNTKVKWLMDMIEHRTDDLFKPVVEIDWLYDFSVAQ